MLLLLENVEKHIYEVLEIIWVIWIVADTYILNTYSYRMCLCWKWRHIFVKSILPDKKQTNKKQNKTIKAKNKKQKKPNKKQKTLQFRDIMIKLTSKI